MCGNEIRKQENSEFNIQLLSIMTKGWLINGSTFRAQLLKHTT